MAEIQQQQQGGSYRLRGSQYIIHGHRCHNRASPMCCVSRVILCGPVNPGGQQPHRDCLHLIEGKSLWDCVEAKLVLHLFTDRRRRRQSCTLNDETYVDLYVAGPKKGDSPGT